MLVIELLILIVITVDVCSLGLVLFLIGDNLDFSVYLAKECKQKWYVELPLASSHFVRAPADYRQPCFPGV